MKPVKYKSPVGVLFIRSKQSSKPVCWSVFKPKATKGQHKDRTPSTKQRANKGQYKVPTQILVLD